MEIKIRKAEIYIKQIRLIIKINGTKTWLFLKTNKIIKKKGERDDCEY